MSARAEQLKAAVRLSLASPSPAWPLPCCRPAPPHLVLCVLSQGNAAFKAGDYTLALAHYSDAIHLDPSVSTYPLNRALVHLRLADYPAADKDASTALKLDAGVGQKALYRRALARKGLGKLDLAKQGPLHLSLSRAEANLTTLVVRRPRGGQAAGRRR